MSRASIEKINLDKDDDEHQSIEKTSNTLVDEGYSSAEKPSGNMLVDDAKYPSTQKQIIIMLALYLAMFLVTLDQNIITTAIPRITDDFRSLDDVGWYGTAYLLTLCSFQLLMGKIYKFYPAKPLFLAGCILFEVGSALCGAAPSSTAFIIGRAIAGLGASGLFSGVMVIMFHTVPLRLRPIYQGAFAAIYALASVIGPLVGGTFTDKITWRWCFYINLPVGAVSIVVTLLFLHLPCQKLESRANTWSAQFRQLDPLSDLAFFPGIICLVLALQWGGTTYPWSSPRIVVLLVLCGIFSIIFTLIQIWKKEDATIPPRILNRSILAAIWFTFFNGSSMMIITYYLPIWFQAIKGASAVKSGIMLLPTIIATVISAFAAGVITSKFGYYAPFFLICSTLTPVSAGLLTTFSPDTGHAEWIGYQVFFGLSLGLGAQQPLILVQTVLKRADIATGSALLTFVRFLGPSVSLPVAQSILINSLVKKLTNLPGVRPQDIVDGGVTELRHLVPPEDFHMLLVDYNAALMNVFYFIVASCAITMLGSVFVEWRSVKTPESANNSS